MSLQSNLQQSYGIALAPGSERRLASILERHRHAFTHFITVHPRRFTHLEDMVTSVRDFCFLSFPAASKNRNARVFLSLGIAPKYLARPSPTRGELLQHVTKTRSFDSGWWQQVSLLNRARAWHHHSDSELFVAPWHFHALVGSVDSCLSPEVLAEHVTNALCRSDPLLSSVSVDAQPLSSLGGVRYAVASQRGNFLRGCQFTNDTYVHSQCAAQLVDVQWCSPPRMKEYK